MLSESDVVVQKLAEAFDALGIPYMIGGSVASSVYGLPRFTQDVDIVALIASEGDVAGLTRLLEAEFYIDADMIRAALQYSSSFNVIYLATMIKADIFIPEDTPWRRQEWARRQRKNIGPPENALLTYLASAEDMVLQKLLWYRETGERSDRQWGDVQGVLKVQGEALDFAYMRQWAETLKITDLLMQALTDAGVGGAAEE